MRATPPLTRWGIPLAAIGLFACGGISREPDAVAGRGSSDSGSGGAVQGDTAGAAQLSVSGGVPGDLASAGGTVIGPATGGSQSSGQGQAAGGTDAAAAAAVCSGCSMKTCAVPFDQCQRDPGCQDIIRCVEKSCQGGKPSCSSGCIGADGSAYMALSLFACVSQKCGKDCIDLGP